MDNSILHRYPFIVVAFVGIVLFFPFLGAIHLFDWDEINFAEAAREMIISSNYLQVQIDFAPFYEKPPLFIWFQVISFKIFGINEFAARFPNAFFGVLSLLTVFYFLQKIFRLRLAYLWVLLYAASILPHLYFKSGIIDPVFNFFIFVSLLFFFKGFDKQNYRNIILAGVLIGLATLSKGPVAFLLSGITLVIYWLTSRKNYLTYLKYLFVYFSIGMLTSSIWFSLDFMQNGPEFMMEFIRYQLRLFSTEDAGHGGFPGFHVIVLLFGCFPASIFAIDAFRKQKNNFTDQIDFIRFNKILFFVVLILFSIVQSKIVHYSSLCYFPLTFLAAFQLDKLNDKSKLSLFAKIMFYLISIIIILIFAFISNIDHFPNILNQLVSNDKFAQDIIKIPSPWKLVDNIPWLILLSAFILFISKSKSYSKKLILTVSSILFATLSSMYIFPSRIEYYTQKQLIDQIENYNKEGFVVSPLGHKSYAHLFYGKKTMSSDQGGKKKETIYFSRKDRKLDLKSNKEYREALRIPGYIFYLKN